MLKLLIIPLLLLSLVDAKSSYSSSSSRSSYSGSSSSSSSRSSSSGSSSYSKPSSYSGSSSSYKPSSSQQTVTKSYDKSSSAAALDSYNKQTTATAASSSAQGTSYKPSSSTGTTTQQPSSGSYGSTATTQQPTVVYRDRDTGGSGFNNFATGYIVSDMLHPNHSNTQQPSTVVVNNGTPSNNGVVTSGSSYIPQQTNAQTVQCQSNEIWDESSKRCKSSTLNEALGNTPQPKKEESHTLLYLFITLIGATAIYLVFFRKY